MSEEAPAEAAERTAQIVARRVFPELSFLVRSSVWRLRFSDDELRAAYALLDAMSRELDTI